VLADAFKAAVLLFLAVVVQATIMGSIQILGGTPDLVLVLLLVIALLRGSIFGALGGFWAGFLLDTAYLGTLGVTSLLLTLAGYWIGRYGETTGRDRRLAPVIAVGTITALAGVFGYVLHYLLDQEVVAGHALVTALLPAFLLNVALALPVHALVRAIVGEGERGEAASEVEVLV
jgi:rod shape-determining protein MreD